MQFARLVVVVPHTFPSSRLTRDMISCLMSVPVAVVHTPAIDARTVPGTSGANAPVIVRFSVTPPLENEAADTSDSKLAMTVARMRTRIIVQTERLLVRGG